MRKDLIRRLERLESRCERENCDVIYYWIAPEDDIDTGLADNERIVRDLYRVNGNWGWARQRITTDPTDTGRSCLPGDYLEDVLREKHASCEYHDRGCSICSGLEHLFSQPAADSP